jgi:peptide/nickel transport system permease protein
MNIKKSLKYFGALFLSVIAILLVYKFIILSGSRDILSSPRWQHWFGTDIIGNDVFLKSIDALLIALFTIVVVIPAIYIGGLIIGFILSYFESARLREFFLNLVHYWVTLPVLLIGIFLLILVGAGQRNVIGILIFVLIPTQSLYVYNQMEEAKKQDFVIAKRSYGFSKGYIFLHHLFPYINNSLNTYTLSRMPEILMMDLAFNFLGLGVQPPNSSFGRMLFEGLSFMFSAWWIWVFPVILVIILFLFANWLAKIVIISRNLI